MKKLNFACVLTFLFIIGTAFAAASITVSTDNYYDVAAYVTIAGVVKDNNVPASTSVAIQVNNSTGQTIFVDQVMSNSTGNYNSGFLLSPGMLGTFNVYASALSVVASTSFTVERAPTVPTTLTPTSGTFGTNTQNSSVSIACSGSTDADQETVYYTIEAYYDSSWHNLEANGDGAYVWNVGSLSSQNNVDLRCKATDLKLASAAYNPTGTLSISNQAQQSGGGDSGGGSSGGGGGSSQPTQKPGIEVIPLQSMVELKNGKASFDVDVKNTGNVALTSLTLKVSGCNLCQYSIQPSSYQKLEPNDKKKFIVDVTLAEETEVKSYDLNLEVKSNLISGTKSIYLVVYQEQEQPAEQPTEQPAEQPEENQITGFALLNNLKEKLSSLSNYAIYIFGAFAVAVILGTISLFIKNRKSKINSIPLVKYGKPRPIDSRKKIRRPAGRLVFE